MPKVERIASEERGMVASLINPKAAGDAVIAYYALRHPAEKIDLFASLGGGGNPIAFLVLARTGLDLFRPLAIPFVASAMILQNLLDEALPLDREVILLLPLEQRDWIGERIDLHEVRVGELMRLEAKLFQPVINVLVVEASSPEGFPRYEIRSRSGAYAAAGVNWTGDIFSEIYVEANEDALIRDFAISVLAAISNRLVEEGKIPLFRLDDSLPLRFDALEKIGFRRTGNRTLIAHATRRKKEG